MVLGEKSFVLVHSINTTRKVYSSGACSLLVTCYSNLVVLKPAEATPKATSQCVPNNGQEW